jgi:hypothetical protein
MSKAKKIAMNGFCRQLSIFLIEPALNCQALFSDRKLWKKCLTFLSDLSRNEVNKAAVAV